MKKIINVLIVCMMLLVSTSCVAQGKVFKEVSKLDGVQAVYISKAMCRMGIGMADLGEVSKAVRKLDGIEVVTCDSKKNVEKVQRLIDETLQESGAELWMSAQQKGEVSSIYAVTDGPDSTVAKTLYILNNEGNELQFVSIAGEFDLTQLTKDDEQQSEE